MSRGYNVLWNFCPKVLKTKDILLGLKNIRTKLSRDILSIGHLMLRTMDPRIFVQGRVVLGRPISHRTYILILIMLLNDGDNDINEDMLPDKG